MHKLLSLTLRVVRKAESLLVRIVRFNRSKAMHVVAGNADPHLNEIARHKEETSLSPAERQKRKNDALRGEL
jgi:hypothetical protein